MRSSRCGLQARASQSMTASPDPRRSEGPGQKARGELEHSKGVITPYSSGPASSEESARLPIARHVASGDAHEVLGKLTDGDPLRLLERCARHVRRRAFLVDAERLFQRSIARVALEAPRRAEDLLSEQWLETRLDGALQDLLREDRETHRRGETSLDRGDSRRTFLTEVMMLASERALQSAVAFNSLSEQTRRVFFQLVFERLSIQECVSDGAGGEDVVREGLLEALRALICTNEVAAAPPPGSNEGLAP